MAHLVIVAIVVLAAWTLLAIPLGMVIGRRLRRVRPARRPRGPRHQGDMTLAR